MKTRTTINLDPATKERLLIIGDEKHIRGGVSGVIEYLAWSTKIKSADILRGQQAIKP